MRTSAISALLVAIVVCSDVVAADTDLEKRLASTIRRVADKTNSLDFQKLLIVVRGRSGRQADPEASPIRQTIRAELQKLIAETNLEGVVSDEVNKLVADQQATKLLQPADVARFEQSAEFDAVLTADYFVVRGKAWLRISLVDGEKRHFLGVVHLPNEPATSNQARNAAGGVSDSTTASRKYKKKDAEGSTGSDNGEDADQPEQSKEQADVDSRIVRFAVENLGKKVGNGECWTLAADALVAAAAMPPRAYDFGREIDLDDIQPGNILQFTSARFDQANSYVILGAPHHTAIVYSIRGDKTFLLHQNFGKKVVTVLDLDLDDKTSGSIQAYRAIPRSSAASQRAPSRQDRDGRSTSK